MNPTESALYDDIDNLNAKIQQLEKEVIFLKNKWRDAILKVHSLKQQLSSQPKLNRQEVEKIIDACYYHIITKEKYPVNATEVKDKYVTAILNLAVPEIGKDKQKGIKGYHDVNKFYE